jgi:hypothetical protein
MDEVERRRWTSPDLLLDPDGTGYLRSLGAADGAPRAQAVERGWRLSDPLLLIEGNDRLTEHLSRVTVARLRADNENPYGLRWARDLEEVLIRYGWEVGWERAPQAGSPADAMLGHQHPEGRGYLPPGRVLEAPAALAPGDWPLSRARPREEYAPAYAPVIVPADAEVLRFPRGDRVVVVAVLATPVDTTDHSRHEHPAFVPAERYRGQPAEAGLFLVPLDGGATLEARRPGASSGAVLLEAPSGRYLASAEVWLPERGLAGRTRVGLDAPPTRQLTVSDLMLLTQALPDSVPLEQAVASARPPGPVSTSEEFAVGWEISGPLARGETLAYQLSITGAGAGFFRRIGQWLKLAGREEPVRLSWEDAGPGGGSGALFRTLSLQIPDLDPGEYRLRLEVTPRSGAPIASERLIRVVRP